MQGVGGFKLIIDGETIERPTGQENKPHNYVDNSTGG